MNQIILILLLIAIGYLFGQRAEKKHYKSIVKRELEYNRIPAIASRFPPEDNKYRQQLVSGSVVIASDYFKTFLAGLINIFGGSIISYESLLDRARREATLRMKEEANQLGGSLIFNIKYETASIGSGRTNSIEVLAYGTAVISSDAHFEGSDSIHAGTQGLSDL